MVNEDRDEQFQSELLLTNIQNADRRIRQNALEKLLAKCDSMDLKPDEAVILYDQFYLAIFKCYADKFESCRELACSIVSSLLMKLPDNDYYAEYIISMICRRIGQTEIIEESEEMRLILLKQTILVVEKFQQQDASVGSDRLAKCYNDTIDILIKTLKDPYREVQRECCTLIILLADATPSFYLRANQLANPLIALLGHRQLFIRKAAVDALGTLALHIHSNGDLLVKIFVSISPLLMDSVPSVRLRCGRAGCLWLLKLRDRYSFFERILPLILCCLKDDTPEIRDEITIEWKRCGALYFEENENELSDLEHINDFPEKYPENVQRPTIGCRAIVQRSIRVISIVVREMQDWKEDIRLHALKLLWQVILHSEKVLTAKFIEIFPTLSRSCVDKDRDCVVQAMKCSELLGMLLKYDDWISQALKELKLSSHLGVLKCFSQMYRGATAQKHKDLIQIAGILVDSSISHNMKAEYQRQLLDLTEMLVDIHLIEPNLTEQLDNLDLKSSKNAEFLLYTILVKVISLAERNADDIPEKGRAILDKLAHGENGVDDFHARYLQSILDSLEDLDSANSERAEPIILLHGLICLCGFRLNYLDSMKMTIKTVLDCAESSGKIKILSAVAVSMLNWNKTMNTTPEDSYINLKKFIEEIIDPRLVWKAGRSSESSRAMTTSVLCSMCQGAPDECRRLFPDLAVQFSALVDDNNVITRAYTLKCLRKCGPIKLNALKPLALGVLARLDDPSAEVRECATKVIGELKLEIVDTYDVENWEHVVKHIVSVLLLHMDDPEVNLRKPLLESITAIAKDHKAIFEECLVDLPTSFPYWNELEDIKKEIIQ